MSNPKLSTTSKGLNGQLVRWNTQQTPGQSQQQQQLQQPAKYNLPGVINYLTSEFTNLERFKIVSNLERSEMKYQILELQGEVNSLKFVNNKQLTRIKELEKELNKKTAFSTGEERNTLVEGRGIDRNEENNKIPGTENISKISEDTANLSINSDGPSMIDSRQYGHSPGAIPATESPSHTIPSSIPNTIPELDLQIIKKSREQLTKSMREIVHLLKVPSAKSTNYLNLPNDHENDLDVLLDHENGNGHENLVLTRSRKSITSQYFGDDVSDLEDFPMRDTSGERKNINVAGVDSNGSNDASKEFGTKSTSYSPEKQSKDYSKEIESENTSAHYNIEDLIGSQIIDPSNDKFLYESEAETEIFDDLIGRTTQLYEDGSYKTEISYDSESEGMGQNSVSETSTSSTTIPHTVHLKVTEDGTEIFNHNCHLTLIKAEDIVDIYPIHIKEKWIFLIVERSGLIQELRVSQKLLEESGPSPDLVQELTLCDLRETTTLFKSTGVIEFKEKSTASSKSYGLVYNSVNKPGAYVLKVFQLTVGDNEKHITLEEIDRFTETFLSKISDFIKSEFITWQVVDSDVNIGDSLQSPRQSKRSKKTCDPKLARYELVFEGVKSNGDKGRFGVNMVLHAVNDK